MEDSVYKKALLRSLELKTELQDVEQFLELYQRFAGTETEQDDTTGESGGPRITRNELAPLIRKSLLKRGRPLTRGQLLEALKEDGVFIGGRNQTKNLGTIIWRLRDQFVNIEGYGYWPRDVEYEHAGYDPDDPNSPEEIERTLDLEPAPDD